MEELTFVTFRAHLLDGIAYNFSIYKGPNGFLAFWECQDYGEQDKPFENLPTLDDAIAKCTAAIERHHSAHPLASTP
jgi:hypothetical protein